MQSLQDFSQTKKVSIIEIRLKTNRLEKECASLKAFRILSKTEFY
jgi:hypothetical protein